MCVYLELEVVSVRLWMVNAFTIMFCENKIIIVRKLIKVTRLIFKLSSYYELSWVKKNMTQASNERPQTLQFSEQKAQQYSTHRHLGKIVYIYFEKIIKMQTVAYSCFLTPDTSWTISLGMAVLCWGFRNLERVKWK